MVCLAMEIVCISLVELMLYDREMNTLFETWEESWRISNIFITATSILDILALWLYTEVGVKLAFLDVAIR
jgi:uncharacterized membrane protein